MRFKYGLLFALLLTPLAVAGLSLTPSAARSDEATDEGAAIPSATELPDKRTATSDTFEREDGERETRLYGSPVNFKDAEGNWEPIDEELEPAPGGGITNGANSFDLHLPEELDEGVVRLSEEGSWISYRLLSAGVDGVEVEGAMATYETSGGDVTYEMKSLSDGLKEQIVLSDPSAPARFRFHFELSDGLTPSLQEDGSIAIKSAAGNTFAVLPAPSIAEAGGSPRSDVVHYSLEPSGEGWTVAVEADQVWLQDPGRKWPARIDPTITVGAPALDCVIASTTESKMCGALGWTYLLAKANYPSSGEDQLGRSLLRFDLSSVPKSASITSATLGLYAAKEAKNVSRVDLYDVSRSWEKAPSWRYWFSDHHDSVHEWESRGGDYGKYMPSPTAVTTAGRGGSQPGWWNFSSPELAWLVQRWLDGIVANNGVLVKLDEESPHVCCIERRLEWESSAGTNKPYLSVKYMEPETSDSKVIAPTDGTKTAKRFLLLASWEHSGVEEVTFQYNTQEGWKNVPEGQVVDQSNLPVIWPYTVKPTQRQTEPLYWDASSLTAGKPSAKVQIRAVLKDLGGASRYTKPVQAEINRDVGGAKDASMGVGPGSLDLLTGNFAVGRSDVSIPVFGGSLGFSRSLNSREAGIETTGILGQGWKAGAPVEVAGGSAWRSLKIESVTENLEGETFTYSWANLDPIKGPEIQFEVGEKGEFITPDYVSGHYFLYRLSPSEIALTDPSGNRTIFSNSGSGNQYLPVSVGRAGGTSNKTRLVYEVVGSKLRLKEVIGQTAEGVRCSEDSAKSTEGCHVLLFSYRTAAELGLPTGAGDRLTKITYYAPGSGGPWEVANYSYNPEGRLAAEWDPRISPALKETYTYEAGGQLRTIKPPGQEAWTMQYGTVAGEAADGRLIAVKRPSLIESQPTAQTTIAYGVPISGSGRPYDLGREAVALWGQQDLPTDATAVFPANEVPSTPPSSYARAVVYYMDAEGQISNVASPPGAGTSAPSITTTETDRFGNTVRELTAQNRLRALAAGAESVTKSRELDTEFFYSPDGSELQEEKGPMHQVALESGASAPARFYRAVQYDQGAPTPGAGEPMPQVPTTETEGALLKDESIVDRRTTEAHYDWKLRLPTQTIVDPGEETENHLNITTTTVYDEFGLPVETRQPSNASGGGAASTRTVYYKSKDLTGPDECKSNLYAGLPCKIEPAAQPGTAGQPQLLVRKFLSYNQLGEPEEVIESPGGGSENVRKTVLTYDKAGRQTSKAIIGGGAAVPKVETLYSSTLGAPTSERFVCVSECTGFDSQATTTTYDALGRVTTYEDADGNKAKTTYDLLGRPVTASDNKGSQVFRYDSTTGLLTELEDSAAGLFKASYDADGNLVSKSLPDGLTAETTYNEADEPVHLTYTKQSSCGATCTWLDFGLERSIHGQVLGETGTLGADRYNYDRAGRLTQAQETPQGGSCATRVYAYNKDSNRLGLTTRAPELGGACSGSGGTTQSYAYDSADRLLASGIAYDSFGRITNLPAPLAGGKELTTSFFANNMVASQAQGGVTNTFTLDASLRQRSRLQGGGLEGTEVFHYDDASDSPGWTERGSAWTRDILGIEGETAAIQESGSEPTLQLTNLHGDIVATAAITPVETKLKGTLSYDEFGNPMTGSSGRFGWLGGWQRRTEMNSGVIQMGVRSYVPTIGRFLSVDPVSGGSANAYDYANQDPVNTTDLGGENTGHGYSGPCEGEITLATDYIKPVPHHSEYGKLHLHYWVQCNVSKVIVVYILKVTQFLERTSNGHKSEFGSHAPGQFHGTRKWGTRDAGLTFGCLYGQQYRYQYEFQYEWHSIGGVAVNKEGDGPLAGEGGTFEMDAHATCGIEWT